MKRFIWLLPILVLLGYFSFTASNSNSLVIYSGRSKALVDPLITKFEQETGIKVQVKYGGTTQLAVALIEEGQRSPADLFWAQDAGALGAVNKAGLLRNLGDNISDGVPSKFKSDAGFWVATSGRARVLAYSSERVNASNLPTSIFELADPKWRGRIAWAPTNGSFQSFVTAMQILYGDERTKEWLIAVKNNGAKNFANNNAILQGIAAGEADLGITNHYYLYRSKAENPNFPVEQTSFESGDAGNMINVAGIAHLRSSKNHAAAQKFIEFLLSEETQMWFASAVYEYPVRIIDDKQLGIESIMGIAPEIAYEDLDDLEETLKLLREVGLL
jgi:iron(III) transport system substrate-binding protein